MSGEIIEGEGVEELVVTASAINESEQQNQAPPTTSFCNEAPAAPTSPAVRFIGGGAIEPQVEPGQGPPNSCTLTMSMVGSLQPALAAFRPVLNIMDLVATLVQCFQLSVQVLTDPTKIKQLLKLLPALVQKLNVVLGLIPQFPQGIQAWVTMIVDIVRFVGTQLDCAVRMLRSIKRQFDELERIRSQIESTDDTEYQASLQQLFDCGSEAAEQQTTDALNSLGPIARLLCAIRALLKLVPGGDQVQKLMALPNPSDVGSIDGAISALEATRDVLLSVVDLLVTITGGLGVLPPLEIGFTCPLDEEVDSPPEDPPPMPEIRSVLGPDAATPTTTVPNAPGGTGPDVAVFLSGVGLTPQTKAFWGAAPMASSWQDPFVRVVLPAGVRANLGAFQLFAVNEPAGGSPAFSSIADPDTGEVDSDVMVSEAFAIEVV